MLRIAALVVGALAGFVASLILALGGLEVSASAFGGLADRQLALARFALIFIANVSLLGAGLTIALPRLGATLLLLAAIAWVAAALAFGHGTDLVLIGPPALGFIASALAIAAGFFGQRAYVRAAENAFNAPLEADPYDVAPASRGYREQLGTMSVPAPGTRGSLDGLAERDFIPGRLNGRSGRDRPEEPPAFRQIEDEEHPPTLLARLGRGVTGLLSFGLYAAAAGAVLLVVYNVYQRDDSAALLATPAPAERPASVASADLPSSSSSSAPATPISSAPPQPASSEPGRTSSSQAASTGVLGQSLPAPGATQPRVVGEPAPEDAVPANASQPVDLEPVSEEPVVAEAAPPGPVPDSIDPSKVPPVPAIMSPEMAEARRNGGALFNGSDI